jgi:hypothetical protein
MLSSKLMTIYCSCGKKIGRGLGYFELVCRHRGNHRGDRMLVLGEVSRTGTKILSVSPIIVEGVTVEMMP